MGRQRLLVDTVAYVRAHGLGDLTLRQLAEAIGSSHRMLLYHFGSRGGLLAAVVGEIERDERVAAAATAATATSSTDALRKGWQRLRAPRRAGEERLFYELAAMAMQRVPGTEDFRIDFVEPWLGAGDAWGTDRVQMRVDVAVVRGLILDLLVTGDRKAADAAFERYVSQRQRASNRRR